MATIFNKKGYGQVEPNHLSAQRTGQIFAQLPANSTIDVLENGMFLKYDYSRNVAEANDTCTGEYMLVYNEVKLYEKNKQGMKDFAQKKEDAMGGVVVPRLFKINDGDIFTTNNFQVTNVDGNTVSVGAKFTVVIPAGKKYGILTEATGAVAAGTIEYELVKLTTMPDGQKAGKFVRTRKA